MTKHPDFGTWEMADWLDDYFGHHRYGVRFMGERRVYQEEKVDSSEMPEDEKQKLICVKTKA